MESRQKLGLNETCQHVADGEELNVQPKWRQYLLEEILV
jgi:hypothetical protein